jgi:hypothetical protein
VNRIMREFRGRKRAPEQLPFWQRQGPIEE